jgi:hypothetical protein
LLAEYDSAVIAAGVFLKAKDTVYYKFNATDSTCLTRCCPNHLLIWYAIEKAANEGYRWIDFGRAAIANAGLGKHKEMWGATGTELPYYFPRAEGAASEDEDGTLYRFKSMIWRRCQLSSSYLRYGRCDLMDIITFIYFLMCYNYFDLSACHIT